MSEYQCYELVAIDRQLTAQEMAELRAISTRAEITPTRFWNAYNWGDLKADPAKLVERYFDAHLYFANWGTHRLILRLPKTRVDLPLLTPYFPEQESARYWLTDEHVLLDFHSETDDADPGEDEDGLLAALIPLRTELLRGDLRPAYLAWLLGIQEGDVGGDAVPSRESAERSASYKPWPKRSGRNGRRRGPPERERPGRLRQRSEGATSTSSGVTPRRRGRSLKR